MSVAEDKMNICQEQHDGTSIAKDGANVCQEQYDCCNNGKCVGNRFCPVNPHDPEKMGQDDGERNKQNDLAQAGNEQGDFSLAQGDKGWLYAILQAEDQHTKAEDADHAAG